MRVLIKTKNFKISPEMKKMIDEKFSGLIKFNSSISDIRVEIEHDAHHLKGEVLRCEANILFNGNMVRVEKWSNSFDKSVNKVKDHLKVILSKERKKILASKRR
ncbi:MAG: HPF/RaiA family ribosome-associated protein [Candidatus Margulisiibacteriota bacterium]|jgi:ribosomal subunit interface protein